MNGNAAIVSFADKNKNGMKSFGMKLKVQPKAMGIGHGVVVALPTKFRLTFHVPMPNVYFNPLLSRHNSNGCGCRV